MNKDESIQKCCLHICFQPGLKVGANNVALNNKPSWGRVGAPEKVLMPTGTQCMPGASRCGSTNQEKWLRQLITVC